MEILHRAWAEINLDNLRANCLQIKGFLNGKSDFMAVVKADAYGHGDKMVSKELVGIADWFAVSNISEGKRLRKQGLTTPVLILGYTPEDCAKELYDLDLTQALLEGGYAQRLSDAAVKAGVKLKVHVAVDTGMSRIGFCSDSTEECAKEIAKSVCLPGLKATGIFTHFAVADEEGEEQEKFTQEQHRRLGDVVWALSNMGISFESVHCCNSAATMDIPSFHHTMVRPGIIMYGCTPDGKPINGLDLKPVMTLKSVVAMVKKIKGGDTVGYGRTYEAKSEVMVATVPLGYADGYPRCLANKGLAFVNDRLVPVIGRICMDQLMLDVTGVEVKPGDEVTFFGDGCPITVDNVAALSGTINYEILCSISKRVPRVYIKNKKKVSAVDYIMV